MTMTRDEKIASARKAAANLENVKRDVKAANSKAAKPKPAPTKENTPPTKYQQLRTLASGVMEDIKGVVPGLNRQVNKYNMKKIDDAVEGKSRE